jgi:hypothetical protein
VVVDHHAGGGVVGELRVEGVAQRLEEGHGARQVAYGQVHEDHLGHRRPLSFVDSLFIEWGTPISTAPVRQP